MFSAARIDLVPADEDHSVTSVLMIRLMVSVPRGCDTRVCTRSEISRKAGRGSRSRSTRSCGSTVAGSKARPYSETRVLIAGNSASVA